MVSQIVSTIRPSARNLTNEEACEKARKPVRDECETEAVVTKRMPKPTDKSVLVQVVMSLNERLLPHCFEPHLMQMVALVGKEAPHLLQNLMPTAIRAVGTGGAG